MRRALSIILFALLAAIAMPANGQLLKKLEEKLRTVVPPAPAPDDASELPPPAPGADAKRPGYLGLEGESDKAGGVRIGALRKAGKAKDSGLKVGDRIIAVDGGAVKDNDEFAAVMDTKNSGDTITLTVIRDGEEQEFKVNLVDPPTASVRPAEAPAVTDPPGEGGPLIVPRSAPAPGRALLGITVISLSDDIRERLGVPVRRGAVITTVRPGSPADRAGLPVDAVVVGMDGQLISNSDELVSAIRAARPGTETELSYYIGDKLTRKSVKLAPASVLGPAPSGYGSERPLVGPPGADRPLLSRVEKVVEGLTRPGPVGPAVDAAEVLALQQSYSDMQAQMKLLMEQIDELEARVKSLEAAALPKPVEEEAPPPKPNVPRPAPPKLDPPARL